VSKVVLKVSRLLLARFCQRHAAKMPPTNDRSCVPLHRLQIILAWRCKRLLPQLNEKRPSIEDAPLFFVFGAH